MSNLNVNPPPYPGPVHQAPSAPPPPPPSHIFTAQPPPQGSQHFYAANHPRQPYGELRMPAYIMASIACCCGNWLFAGPALLLAVLPDCTNSGNHRAMHIASIVLSVISMALVVVGAVLLIALLVDTESSSSSSSSTNTITNTNTNINNNVNVLG